MNNIKNLNNNIQENLNDLNEIIEKESNNINIISHLKDIEEIMETLNSKLEDINQNFNYLNLSKYATERINNSIIAKETIKPFIPYMVYYNIMLQSKYCKNI